MNSFISKIGKWMKNSAFGLIVTSIALVFVISVGIIINDNSKPVANVTNSANKLESVVESMPPVSDTTTPAPTIEKIRMPFTVNAKIARYFFDSNDSSELLNKLIQDSSIAVNGFISPIHLVVNKKFAVKRTLEN